ncbi:hypothetical protein SmJEL517_g05611 [Synchytrium microbalum]|uniref:TIP41-like protein n=1 Tax=Synchytrium microbalum TaxID=1806994 RepID=A0A507BK85_9FUNG|nr:uncharacterized protein SmJEL517_g05611 [Synchytrium microbalum]TPX30920.1 hypothetical protein SmJEL517_g05611 [Synchytrium microbalum]
MLKVPLQPHHIPYRLNKDGIDIGEWSIQVRKGPIAPSSEQDEASEKLGFKPPVMYFSKNALQVLHIPTNLSVVFLPMEALKRIDISSTSADGVKVAYAESWTKNSAAAMEEVTGFVKPYDWTYTTDYTGSLYSGKTKQAWQETDLEIDIERLKLPEPILFYDEAVLYEDELDDNGTAVLSIRVRVMPSCFLVLLRYFLRVDNVIFRVNDTRLYHEFGQSCLIREFSSREAPYATVRNKLPKPAPWEPNKEVQDLSHLTDANWVASVLPPPKLHKRERVIIPKTVQPESPDEDTVLTIPVPSIETMDAAEAKETKSRESLAESVSNLSLKH